MSYNPKPPRVWSRVQNPCTYILDSSYNTAYSPLTGKNVPLFEANYHNKLISKGNILQYKKNSSNLTKNQKYTQICKGMWNNRTRSYATQTQTYTNPNTSNLLRVNYASIPSPDTTYISGPYNYNIPYPNGCVSDIIKDGGSLVCNKVANPCTDEVIDTSISLNCYPTTCSDVPGAVQDLCWNPKLESWYPRQQYTMPTSNSSWPEGYKGFVSAEIPASPVLIFDSSFCDSVTLSWSVTNNPCIPISSYNIYVNGEIYTNVRYTTTSITINNLLNGNNSFNVTSVSNTIESDKSNTIIVNINIGSKPPTPVLTLDSSVCDSVTLSWSVTNNPCIPISSYNIYVNGIIYTNVPYTTTTITINGLSNGNYSFYVTSLSNTTESDPSNTINVTINVQYQPFTYTGTPLGINYDSTNEIWSIVFNSVGTITFTANINNNVFTTIVGGGGGGGRSNTATGGEGGFQAVNSFNSIVIGSSFIINQIGNGGAGTSTFNTPGTRGTSTIFTGPDTNLFTYNVTSGNAGQTSGGQVTGASYSGPPGTSTYTGSGGYGGGPWSGNCSGGNLNTGYGGDSYLYTNSASIQTFTGINILQYIQSIYGIFIGGGGGTGGTIGGEGGSQIGNGLGGATSCSLNLNTQDAKGYGGGGGGYDSAASLDRSGNGKQGLFILFFSYTQC